MGKVQKKATDKHKSSLSPALADFIDKTRSLPLPQLPRHLETFPARWPFPRGDLYNWIGPLDRFDEILQKFNKTYGLSDGPQTIPFGNTVLKEGSTDTSSAELQELGFETDGDRVLVQSILAFSRILLEKFGNRTLYNSTERLNELLNTTSLPLLHETLRLTLVLAQRFADRPPQTPGHSQFYHFDLDKLLKFATPVPRAAPRRTPQSPLKTSKPKEKSSHPKLRRAPTAADPNDFRALARQNTSSNPETPAGKSDAQEPDWASVAHVRVVWSSQDGNTPLRPHVSRTNTAATEIPSSPTPARLQQLTNGPHTNDSNVGDNVQGDASGMQHMEFSGTDLAVTTIEDVLKEVPDSMPKAVRYELLHKLRIAYGLLATTESRIMLLQNRLTALCTIGQVYNEEELTTKYFDGDVNATTRQQLVLQLVNLLRESKNNESSISLYVQSLAIDALTILSRYKQMSPDVAAALSPNSSHGLLLSLVQRALADIKVDGDATDNDAGDDWRHAVFMLWMTIMAQSGPHASRSSEQYVHKNLIVAYASALQTITGKSLRIHILVLEFLKNLFHHFKDGLQVLNANGAFNIVCEATDKLAQRALELQSTGHGMPNQWRTSGIDFKIPYMQGYVLRELIALVDDVSGHQGNHADRALRGFVDSSNLLGAFRLILSHIEEFGAHTWSKVVKAVCSFLNNEPTSYTIVSEAGIISTLLGIVQPQSLSSAVETTTSPRKVSVVPSKVDLKLPPINDAILNLATAFSAICLTEAGHAQFVKSSVLEKFFELFESPEHVKAIKDPNTLVQLGSTFDELVRHHPGLKNAVTSAVIIMIGRVHFICTSRFQAVGAGPKLWTESSTDRSMITEDMDVPMSDEAPETEHDQAHYAPLELPNKDILEFPTTNTDSVPAPTLSPRDEDEDGLNVLDYARPVIGFLAAFLDTQFLCKELMDAGATDLILDFITLPTLPVTEDTFSDGLIMHDLTSVVRNMAEQKPYLVVPVLLDRAIRAVVPTLGSFANFKPERIQCYFGPYLSSARKVSAMDIDLPGSSGMKDNGTRVVRSLLNVYCLTRVLAEVFTPPSYPSRAPHNSVATQINITDQLYELICRLGSLSAACVREEISLLALMPQSWLDATRPGTYSTGDDEVDAILNVSNERNAGTADDGDENKLKRQNSIQEVEGTPAFRNLKTLRYLVTETSASLSAFYSRVGASLSGRRKPETVIKQKVVTIADALANAFKSQVNPAFMAKAFVDDDESRSKDWRFKYYTVVLNGLRDSLWEDSQTSTHGPKQPYVVERFKLAGGMKILTEIGYEFFNELKSCEVAQSGMTANVGLKLCLQLFDDITNADLLLSAQSAYMKDVEGAKGYLFNPNQLLLELRMESLPLARRIWDSEYAEQASNDVVRRLASIIQHTLKGDNEDGVVAKADEFPKTQDQQKRKYIFDKAKVNTLIEKGYSQDMAEEALYRCNIVHGNQVPQAEEYCKAFQANPHRRRLRIPEGEAEYKGQASTPSQTPQAPAITGMTLAIDISGSGPTATIFEDSSPDEDAVDETRAPDTDTAAGTTAAPSTNTAANTDQKDLTGRSPMHIRHILNSPEEPPRHSLQNINDDRASIREHLAERCNNILTNHPSLVFELNDLLCAASAKLNDETAKNWWEATTDLLVSSLLSQDTEQEITETQGKKIAATSHLIGLLTSNDIFRSSMLKVLQDSVDSIIGFLQLPAQKSKEEESYPWIAPILLILEKMLAMDSEPDKVTWNIPSDLESCEPPKLTHSQVVEQTSKDVLFDRLMTIVPKVGKDRGMALSIVRVLVILTRDRALAQKQGERRNLQKLFLMVKQLAGGATGKFESAFVTILRHIIEDDDTIKQIMRTEIANFFRSRSGGRQLDLTTYLKDLNWLALRSPSLFVQVSNEKVKLNSWSPGQASASSHLELRQIEQKQTVETQVHTNGGAASGEAPARSIEQSTATKEEASKPAESQMPVVQHPDGVIHFLLSELLSYKDVEDKEATPAKEADKPSDPSGEAQEAIDGQGQQPTNPSEKSEKPRFKSDEHPIFIYRCFIMHCLTELLYSYNQTKIEFIGFSRKADPLAATPSKARSGVLNYLLNGLVSSGHVDKDESISCRKQLATSDWAMKVIVALCTKTSEETSPAPAPSRYPPPRQIEDNDTEPNLTFVRKFVLDHAIKAFKDAFASSESMQARYARLLCLADLFAKMVSKPAGPGPDQSASLNNTSYKRLARMMLEKNFIAILTAAISDIDLSFPGAKKVIKFILRPLKELTAMAAWLSENAPDEFPQVTDQLPSDNVSSASSEVSELDDTREETPDFYRNSALGMLDRGHRDHSDSDEDDEDDEEMFEDEYDDEMDYDDNLPTAVNDGEVVSDEELDDVVDDGHPMEGLPGDVPMDIEFVVDHHHHHDDDESSSSDDDEDEDDIDSEDDDDEDEGEDIEIEMEDDDEDVPVGDIGADMHDEDGDDGWEDENDEDDEAEGEEIDFGDDEVPVGDAGADVGDFNTLMQALQGEGLAPPGIPRVTDLNLMAQANDADAPDEDEDQDDDAEDPDEEGMDYDHGGFDMMLDGPDDFDENDDWGWDEPPPPAAIRRAARHRGHPPIGGFFTRRILNEHDMHHHMLGGPRHHRHAPSSRNAAEDGTNPLLQRPNASSADPYGDPNFPIRPMGFAMPGARGPSVGVPFMVPGPGGAIGLPMDVPGIAGGHGAILDAIIGALQRGEGEALPNGRMQISFDTPLQDILRGPTVSSHVFGGQLREDPQRSAQFVPMLTSFRWQEEARMIFGKDIVLKIQPIQTWVMSQLVPQAQKAEKERRRQAEERKKAEAEAEAQRKIEEERRKKEEGERLARETVEAEEKARAEAEARANAAVQDQSTETTTATEPGDTGDVMEGVENAEQATTTAEAESSQSARIYTSIRGRQLDITGLDIDLDYLEALPEELREEVIMTQYQARREQTQEEGGNDASGIDPDFLDALPDDIREEIRTAEAAAQRRRDREAVRREAQAAAGSIAPAREMDNDDFFATMDPELRRAILAEQPPEILDALNPQFASEGRQARNLFYHRAIPTQRDVDAARGRRDVAQRDARRQQIIQLVDKAGVATLLRLMFLNQQGSLKTNLMNILGQLCANRQTRYEVVSLLLVILKEGSTDVTAVERSLASLSLRAQANGAQKTPQSLRRTLSIQQYAGMSEDVTPMLVVQQCLNTLSHICKQNAHVKSLFLREVDVTPGNKSKGKARGKTKETKTTTHPVNDLISLLDRRLIMDNAGCLLSLASLLATVTSPLMVLMRMEEERVQAEKKKAEDLAKVTAEKESSENIGGGQEDTSMEDVPATQSRTEAVDKGGEDANVESKDNAEVAEKSEEEKRKPFEPPTITDHNLKLITGIFVAPECDNETFKRALETVQSLAHIPRTSKKFGKELIKHVHSLCQAICSDLEELLPAIRDAQSSTDVQGLAAAKFSVSTSDQVKLLRVLQALDWLSAPKKDEDPSETVTKSKSILTLSYESLSLGPLWTKLSECLTLVEEKGDTISFANILLPLIESLMVVCKHTTLKDTPIARQVKDGAVTSPEPGAEDRDDLEELFFKFTSEHRKILNDIVRQNPKLMQGHFAILVKNSKVLDFDNKRNYFNKQIHSRHHAQRHPQPPLQLNVRRDQVFIDSYKALYFKTADEMKYGKLNIRFNGEEGVDAGGVTREWFQVLARGMFDPNYALFQPVASDRTTFHPSSLSRVNPEHLLYFKFVGRIIGKALHEGRVLDCHFSRAVYKRILGKSPNLKDLESNDVDYYKSLVWILENDITDILTEEFCVIEDEFGEEKVIDLIPDGRNIAVAEENKKEYVQKLVEYRLTESVKEQLDSFLVGFHDIIPAELISIFNEQELELLISGLPEIDVDDWKANTEYHNYNPSSQQVVWFWRIVKVMTNEERAKLLQFITGTSKVPLNGFKELEGVSGLTKCNIHKDPSTNRLPTSHTCFNQLDLPAYESFEVMKQNINTAISLGADYFGFA